MARSNQPSSSSASVGATPPSSTRQTTEPQSRTDSRIRGRSAAVESQEALAEQCLVVGFDLGATFSSVGYIWVNHAQFRDHTLPESLIKKVKVLGKYKDAARCGGSPLVVPTVLTYQRTGNTNSPVKWGYSSCLARKVQDANLYKIELFKFLFSNQHDDLEAVKSLRRIAQELQKDEVDFTADFLRLLNADFEDKVKREYPECVSFPRYYYCGVPAGWGVEKARIADACHKAGLTGITLVSEPEAAANSLLSHISDRLQQNEIILVVDAGGMTVDVVPYQVERIHPPLTRAITSGESWTCGAAMLNQLFRRDMMQSKELVDRRLGLNAKSNIVDNLVEDFENLKKSYDGEWASDEELKAMDYHHRTPKVVCMVRYPNTQMKRIFDKVIGQIFELVSNEIIKCQDVGQRVNRILLTGGLSENSYYCTKMRHRFQDIRVEEPNDGIVNVPRGIVATALNQSSISQSRSRFNIGIDERQDYNPKWHQPREAYRVFCDKLEKRKMVDSIHWLLKKGDIIPTISNPLRPYARQRTIPTNRSPDTWMLREDIIVSQGEPKEHLHRFNIDYPLEEGADLADDLRSDCWAEEPFKIDLRNLTQTQQQSLLYEDYSRPGHGFRTMDYEISLYFDKGSWNFIFNPLHADPQTFRRTHSFKADGYYGTHTEIGTLLPLEERVSDSGESDTEINSQEDVRNETNALTSEQNDQLDNSTDASYDPDEFLASFAPTALSTIQQGKRPVRVSTTDSSPRSQQDEPPLSHPQYRSLGENSREKPPTDRRWGQKRPAGAGSGAGNDTAGASGGPEKRAKRGKALIDEGASMDELRHSHPGAGSYLLRDMNR